MSSPISRIGGQRAVTRDEGSEGHVHVAKQLDGQRDGVAQMPRNKKVDEVAKMYERQFLGEMFKAMRSTVTETDKPSMAQEIYKGQQDEQYLDAWSEKGGVGFSNIIYDQIMERYFGQTASGQNLKKQGMIPLTNQDITNVSRVENGVAKQIIPKTQSAAPAPDAAPAQSAVSVSKPKTFEETEPMPAPTPAPLSDDRSVSERVAAGELFPATAVAKTKTDDRTEKLTETAAATGTAPQTARLNSQQTALQVEVRPSPTGSPAKIQAPWDAVVVQSTKLDGSRSAVTLEHGPGVRSTLVFDGVVGSNVKPGEKIPRGQTVGTLNADAKSFLWNLATTGQD